MFHKICQKIKVQRLYFRRTANLTEGLFEKSFCINPIRTAILGYQFGQNSRITEFKPLAVEDDKENEVLFEKILVKYSTN